MQRWLRFLDFRGRATRLEYWRLQLVASLVAGVSVTVLFHVVAGFGEHIPAVAGGLAASLIALVVVSKFHPHTRVPVLQRS